MKLAVSTKHFQINKANNMILVVMAVSAIITVFCLVSAKALLSQASYQRKVISEKDKAVDQLKENVKAGKELAAQYNVFEKADPNIIGGKGGDLPGEGPLDGDNPRIVLDALPSQYDFPALASSVEKIVTSAALIPSELGGTDEGQDSLAAPEPTANPTPSEMGFTLEVSNTYLTLQTLIKDLERSIRPIDVQTVEFAGKEDAMTLTIKARTYFQLGSGFVVGQKEVK
ncbi:hypothetical protein H0X09_03330 [Candidatus Saccharibacteria bacterium]|nr:hypothetical protein [Candidatus Saccharibacteria bacterium]